MFCQRSLGSNEVVEPFPVGRRLAFDEAKGRLWVVCRKCGRWNLTPLEERWEGVEECERLFRGTRLRTSTENIGLARHPEGLELVRIGAPLRPEFAAWRYGDQFRRRWRRLCGMTGALGLAIGLGYVPLSIPVAGALYLATGGVVSWIWHDRLRSRAKLRIAQGKLIKLRFPDALLTRLRPAEDEVGFRVNVKKSGVLGTIVAGTGQTRKKGIWLEGEEARRAAVALFPIINYEGAPTTKIVQMAVDRIEHAGHPSLFLPRSVPKGGCHLSECAPSDSVIMPPSTRLAFEMALHEEQERRALEGELWLLERAWKEAEELAAISDDLLLPEGFEEFVREHRTSSDPQGPAAAGSLAGSR